MRIDDKHPPVIQSREEIQLRIHRVGGRIFHVVVCDQMIGQNTHLRADLRGPHRDRAAVIGLQNTVMQQNAGNEADQKNQNKDSRAQTAQNSGAPIEKFQFVQHRFLFQYK